MLYRVKQFFLSIFPKVSKDDINFVDKYLDDFEANLFFNLKKSEQSHSIRVAKLAVEMYKSDNEYKQINIDRIIKSALLHDIGKGVKKINVFEKVIMVVVHKIFGDKIKKYSSYEFVDSYFNHGEISYSMLKDYVQDEKLLFLIKNHHLSCINDKELALLKYCDDRN